MQALCVFREDGELYPGTVTSANPDGTYVFSFEDGDVCPDATEDEIKGLDGFTEKVLDDVADGQDFEDKVAVDDEQEDPPYSEDFAGCLGGSTAAGRGVSSSSLPPPPSSSSPFSTGARWVGMG